MKSRAEKIEQIPNPATAEIVKRMPDYMHLTEDYAMIQNIADELRKKIQLRETLWTALQRARADGSKEKTVELAEKMMNVSGEIATLAKTIDQTEDAIIQKETATLQMMMDSDSDEEWEH